MHYVSCFCLYRLFSTPDSRVFRSTQKPTYLISIMIQFVDLLVDYLSILSIRSFRQKPLEAVSPEIWSIRALHIAYLEERRLR